jgi:hypothetical protein
MMRIKKGTATTSTLFIKDLAKCYKNEFTRPICEKEPSKNDVGGVWIKKEFKHDQKIQLYDLSTFGGYSRPGVCIQLDFRQTKESFFKEIEKNGYSILSSKIVIKRIYGKEFDFDENGKLFGFAEIEFEEGYKWSGQFRNGKLNGNGKKIIPFLQVQEGHFINNVLNGWGSITTYDPRSKTVVSQFKGLFKNNILSESDETQLASEYFNNEKFNANCPMRHYNQTLCKSCKNEINNYEQVFIGIDLTSNTYELENGHSQYLKNKKPEKFMDLFDFTIYLRFQNETESDSLDCQKVTEIRIDQIPKEFIPIKHDSISKDQLINSIFILRSANWSLPINTRVKLTQNIKLNIDSNTNNLYVSKNFPGMISDHRANSISQSPQNKIKPKDESCDLDDESDGRPDVSLLLGSESDRELNK